MKKLLTAFLALTLVVGLLAGCGRKAVEPGETPTGTAKAEGTTNQTESTGQTDATQATNVPESTDAMQGTEVTENTDATQGTEPSQEQKPPKEPEPEEYLEPLVIPVYKKETLLKDMIRLGVDSASFYGLSASPYACQDYTFKHIPTTAVRLISADHSYAIYETDTGCRVYLFFYLPENARDASDAMRKGYPIAIKDMLSYSDFANLKVGDSIDAVEQVDSVISLYKDRYGSYNLIAMENREKQNNPVCSVHYLKDGILKIIYTMPEEGKLVISEIIYNEDYCLTDKLDRTISYKIKPIDLPTA